MKTNRIEIAPYDEGWPAEFQRIAEPLRAVLGDAAPRIDHIGSTSVPGLAAKNVIDIQVTVETLDDDKDRCIAALTALGYTSVGHAVHDHVPPGWSDDSIEWRKMLFSQPEGARRVNLHVREADRANQRYALLFRDYLRVDETARGAYSRIKEALARLHPDDAEAYYDVKDPACDLIISAAERWAASTGYKQGPPDL